MIVRLVGLIATIQAARVIWVLSIVVINVEEYRNEQRINNLKHKYYGNNRTKRKR